MVSTLILRVAICLLTLCVGAQAVTGAALRGLGRAHHHVERVGMVGTAVSGHGDEDHHDHHDHHHSAPAHHDHEAADSTVVYVDAKEHLSSPAPAHAPMRAAIDLDGLSGASALPRVAAASMDRWVDATAPTFGSHVSVPLERPPRL